MFELDFLWVGEETKTGDAIVAHFTDPESGEPVIIVVDGGYTEVGERIVKHVNDRFGTSHVDVVVSTHPDDDHVRGLTTVIEDLDVDYLLIHRPDLHGHDSDAVKSQQVKDLVALAEERGVKVIEPFEGVRDFGNAFTVVGPSVEYYEELLDDEEEEYESDDRSANSYGSGDSDDLVAVEVEPPESLVDDNGGTSARNNTSVIINLVVDGVRALLTGDAGVPALERAADYMESVGLDDAKPSFFQIPHHGSRHNLDPGILDRLLGSPGERPADAASAIATVGTKADDFPRPEVANAVRRRGHKVFDTRGSNFWWHRGGDPRGDYTSAKPLPWLDEDV